MNKINVNSTVTAFAKVGEGPPILLMHGNEADHHMFDELSGHLAKHFTVYAYDQRDCGATENEPIPYSLVDLGRDAAGLLTALGVDEAFVYGTSFGGLVAQALASLHPNLVRKLVLGNTFRPGDFCVHPEAAEKLLAYRSDQNANAASVAELFFPLSYIREHPSVIEMFRDRRRSADKRARRGAILASTSRIDLSHFERPVLLLSGSEDRVIPPTATMSIAASIKHAECLILEGIGHVGCIQDPKRVAQELRHFLLDKMP
jgi:pimeloyl-ACP methyl ester carboxylesterase